MDNAKIKLLETLALYGASNAKISKKQEMKLKEYILPYLWDELNFGWENGGIIKNKEMRKFIDSWEADDLNEKDYKYYYVDKNSSGKSLWDLF